jgi:O-acetyl-ADP-ribose deacetylase (regulator of RNase III)
MRILLVYRDKELGEAFKNEFKDQTDVAIVEGDITNLHCDAIVSPANSFGFMDGGLDLALSEKFGWDIQDRLQERIRSLSMGELLIGQALVIEISSGDVRYLISAPTMRVPTDFNIDVSVNAYLAMKAILVAASEKQDIKSIAVPGLCTGVGKMPYDIAARQMFMAYNEIILGDKPVFQDFGDAQKHHWEINKKGMIWT